MRILAHRGMWNDATEKNTPEALLRALENGFGIESDVRDYLGRLVISHDTANTASQDAEEVFRWLNKYEDQFFFAINIKADGLKSLLKDVIARHRITKYFLFDMSVPQMIEFRDEGLRFFTRQSEVEENPVLYESAAGVWIDGFWNTNWITRELLEKHISNKKDICIVSPDLHNREYIDFWRKIKEWDLIDASIFLCTDHPREAREFFYDK